MTDRQIPTDSDKLYLETFLEMFCDMIVELKPGNGGLVLYANKTTDRRNHLVTMKMLSVVFSQGVLSRTGETIIDTQRHACLYEMQTQSQYLNQVKNYQGFCYFTLPSSNDGLWMTDIDECSKIGFYDCLFVSDKTNIMTLAAELKCELHKLNHYDLEK